MSSQCKGNQHLLLLELPLQPAHAVVLQQRARTLQTGKDIHNQMQALMSTKF